MDLLFLDDLRDPSMCVEYMKKRINNSDIYLKDWIVVRSYGQFINYIVKNGLPTIISFDNDLGDDIANSHLDKVEWFDENKNKILEGIDCANWLVNYCLDNNLKLPKCLVHSANPSGYENIKSLLSNFEKYQNQ